MNKIGWLFTAAVAAALLAGTAHAQQGYLSKPVRMLVGFPPGGGTDSMARIVGAKLAGVSAEPAGNTPEEFAAFIRSETEKWGRVIPTGKISLE